MTTPPLILGGNVFGWSADRAASFGVLDAFVAGGGRMIDTADVYSAWVPGNVGGESETIIGEWLVNRGRRDDVLIATKVGMKPDGPGALSADRIATCVEASLKRLRTDYIDLYYAHRDDAETPLEVTLGAFDRLVRAGKVRAIGASNYDAARLARAEEVSSEQGLARYTVLQPHYNLLVRELFEGSVQELCLAQGIAVVPYFPLASGFLTGKYRKPADLEGRARRVAAEKYLNEFGLRVLAVLDKIAIESNAAPAQIALAWLSAQPAVTAPIASATSVAQIEELLAAMRLKLTAEQLATLNAVSAKTPGVPPRNG
ncbi:MAG: aldo/keto reductase [Planctomycetota bacterium]|nr:aldo/keto reductase [Planctomycetota bacterium]